jgi:diguanylate cyclase (GGDEF)-like protein
MIFEAQSIIFACATNLAVISVGLAVEWRRKRDPVLRDWSIGCGAGAIGSALNMYDGGAAALTVSAAANTLMFLFLLCAHSGLRRLLQLRPLRGAWLLLFFTAALDAYFIQSQSRPDAWPMICSYVRVAISLAAIIELLRERGRMPAHGFIMLFVILGFGVVLLTRLSSGFGQLPTQPVLTLIADLLVVALTLPMMLGLQALHASQTLIALGDSANTDLLTGLRNRRRFNEMAGSEMRRSAGGAESLWLLMIDIDHFKKINDAFGQLEGDNTLRQISQVLRETVRSSDIISRYGGEEFCVLLPGIDMNAAHLTAQCLLRRVSELRVGPQAMHSVTISIGATTMDGGDSCLDDILRRADHSLYLAKHAGRNRVVGFGAA